MKTLTKVVLSSTVLAGTAVAAHAATTPVPLPSTGSTELVFVLQDATNGTSYDLVLSQTVGSATGSYFNAADAGTAGPVQGTTSGTIYNETNFSLALAGDTALQTFISNATTAGQTLQWGIYNGTYTSTIPATREVRGSTLVVTTGTSATILPVAETAIGSTIPNDLATDIKGLNAGTFDSFSGQTPGYMTSAATVNQNFNLYGTGVAQAAAIGSTESLYGLTGNGTTTGQALSYLLGTVTFNGTTLAFTGVPNAVPIPAAGWLLGSGILGLLGVARRKRDAAVA
jgi:hypothetical protein